MRVGITAPGQAKKTIEKQPQTASPRRDQSDCAEKPPSGRDFDMLDILYRKTRRCA
jgi:hypothetical protein